VQTYKRGAESRGGTAKKGGGSRWFSDVKKQLESADMGEGLLDLSQLPQIPELHTLVAGGGLSCITIPVGR